MRKTLKPRVFLGLIDICGVYRSMEIALQENGHKAYFLNTGREHRISRQKEPLLAGIYLFWLRNSMDPEGMARVLPNQVRRGLMMLSILALIIWICFNFDAILFKSGVSFTRSGMDLAWFRKCGKTVLFSFHGSDSRPRFLCAADLASDQLSREALSRVRNGLASRAKHADFIIDSPTSAHWQPKICCLRQVIFTPSPRHAMRKQNSRHGSKGPVRILHCPSLPELKGTDRIRETIRVLRSQGRDIEYVEITGVPNERVIDELARCDIAVDELYSDNYGGIFALEAMTVGTPVVVGGYAKQELDRFVPDWARAPTEYVHPDDLLDRVRLLVDDPAVRERSRIAARRYANEVVAPAASARRLIQLINGDAPDSWFFDPRRIRYAFGAVGPDWKALRNIRILLDRDGAGALLLDDKPELRDALIEIANAHSPRDTLSAG